MISCDLLLLSSMHAHMCSSSRKMATDGWRKASQHMLAALSHFNTLLRSFNTAFDVLCYPRSVHALGCMLEGRLSDLWR